MTYIYITRCDSCHTLIHVEVTMVVVHTSAWSVHSQNQVTAQFLLASERERAQWHMYVPVQISLFCHHRTTRPALPTVQLDSTVVAEMMINAYRGSGSKLWLKLLSFSLLCIEVCVIWLSISQRLSVCCILIWLWYCFLPWVCASVTFLVPYLQLA